MLDIYHLLFIIGGIMLTFIIGFTVMLPRWYHKANGNQALIRIGGLGKPQHDSNGIPRDNVRISFDTMWVVPIIHKLEVLDLDIINFEIERIHENGLICKDYIRADIKANFYISINTTQQDIRQVVMGIGTEKALKQETIENLFTAKFSEAMKTVAVNFDFEELIKFRDEFKKQILMEIGNDLHGYSLDGAAIDYLEQTKLEYLDPNNILDAKGIEKIKKSRNQDNNN